MIRDDGLGCTVVFDDVFDRRQAFSLLAIVSRRFEEQYPWWDELEAEQDLEIDGIDVDFIASYKDAVDVVQDDLDQTRSNMVEVLSSLMLRGERLESLTLRSSDLATRSASFGRRARALNAFTCCGCPIC